MLPVLIFQIEDEGDRSFISALYTDHYRLMRYTAIQFGLRQEADDIINASCVKLIEKIPLLKTLDCCTLRSYIVSTVKGTSLDYLKKRKQEAQYMYYGFENDVAQDLQNTQPSGTGTPEQLTIRKEDVLALVGAIRRLPDLYRDVLEFKYLLELTDAEIAKLLNVSPSSIRMYLTRARRLALELMTKEGVPNA